MLTLTTNKWRQCGIGGLWVSLALLAAACAKGPSGGTTATATTPAATATATTATAAPATAGFQIPVEYYKLDNGLRVVLSPDTTSPTVTVAVYYNIGFRIEPKDRTGFAHLFEHMMFQGSQNLGKMEFVKLVQKNGGVLNGSTRFDYTNYFETLPSHKLETALWAESDRMKGLAITQENLTNQQGVVKSEVRVNVLNQPYGGFPWLDMPQHANTNWYNAHNFYGDLKDLDAATLEDVQSFFKTFYAPNNAVLAVVGDFKPDEGRAFVQQYFAGIPASNLPPQPDIAEPRQTQEKRVTRKDSLANKPALAFAYHMPDRNTPEYYAMGLLDQILLQGNDSRLYQSLVQKKGYTSSVTGGINAYLGNMFNYKGPMLWLGNLIHDSTVPADSIVAQLDQAVADIQQQGVTPQQLELARTKVRSGFYSTVSTGFGRADLLASFALFDDQPGRINELEAAFRQVTPEVVQRTVREYLRPTNRTILLVEPVKK